MRNELSMQSRAEVTTKYAMSYVKASKKDKGRILDEVVGVTGWWRDNARRGLTAATRWRQAGRDQGEEAAGAEVLLRHAQGPAAGVGGFGWTVREVPRGLDATPAVSYTHLTLPTNREV